MPTTLKASDPRNPLSVTADPVVIPHSVLGTVLFFIEAPAPDFIGDEYFASNQIRVYDVDTANVIPTAYYIYNYQRMGFIKARGPM